MLASRSYEDSRGFFHISLYVESCWGGMMTILEEDKSQIIDTHAHLDDEKFHEDREDVVTRAKEARLEYIINVGCDLSSSQKALALAEEFPMVYAGIGVHPHDAQGAHEGVFRELKELSKHNKVVAIGEIGLDYHYDFSPRELQREVFLSQLALGKELDLPVIIHDREAHGDIMEALKSKCYRGIRGVLHCFSGSYEMAKECMNLGYYISFAGPITFTNSRRLQEVVSKVPLDFILVETDSPYLTPEPYRGKRNEPMNVRLVIEKIAEIKGLSYQSVAEKTLANAKTLFGLS